MNEYYLGIDMGSVSLNIVLMDGQENIVNKLYMRTNGQPIKALCEGLKTIVESGSIADEDIKGVGTTGSGRKLAGLIVGADIVKNEITAHAIAALKLEPNVRTIIEIGGQDSKIIILKDGIVHDFAMNTVCAAGTGSFLDRQAARLDIPIEEFGGFALKANAPVRIAGRCAVFAESDMIHKQQSGHSTEDIIAGLCDALVRNYLSNLAKGKNIEQPIMIQGGVAANVGIVAAFEKAIGEKLTVSPHYDVMGALGAAILAKREIEEKGGKSNFNGFGVSDNEYKTISIECDGCSNSCEVIKIMSNETVVACWGDKCQKYSNSI